MNDEDSGFDRQGCMACMKQVRNGKVASQYWNSAYKRVHEYSPGLNYKIVDRGAQGVARQGWVFCVVCVSKGYSPAKCG